MPTDRAAKKKRKNQNPSKILQKRILKLCSAAKKGDQAALAELKSLSGLSSEANRILASIANTNRSGPTEEKFRYDYDSLIDAYHPSIQTKYRETSNNHSTHETQNFYSRNKDDRHFVKCISCDNPAMPGEDTCYQCRPE